MLENWKAEMMENQVLIRPEKKWRFLLPGTSEPRLEVRTTRA